MEAKPEHNTEETKINEKKTHSSLEDIERIKEEIHSNKTKDLITEEQKNKICVAPMLVIYNSI